MKYLRFSHLCSPLEPLALDIYASKTLIHQGTIESLCALVLGCGDTKTIQEHPLPSAQMVE